VSLSPRTFSLFLATRHGLGGRSLIRILVRNELNSVSPEDFLKLDPSVWREEYRLTKKAVDHLSLPFEEEWTAVEAFERQLSAHGVRLVTANDAAYPSVVETMDPDPPSVLYMYGNEQLLQRKTFTVMASRGSLPADLREIETLAEQGVLQGEVLVTGHDRPEYQRAAVVPLRWGSPRILVLDRGLYEVLGPDLRQEAFRAARLWRYEFDSSTDLVVSPFHPTLPFMGLNNQVRDRLIACLAHRLDFVHLNEGGVMERLVRLALKAGRPVRVSDRLVSARRWVEAGATRIDP
jgi:DNA processing protein